MSNRELAELIQHAEQSGLSRRKLLKLFASGGVGAVLAACERPPDPGASTVSVELPWVKDPAPFIQHPTNLETRLELLDGVITPNELFFVRNHAPTPRLDSSEYVVRVTGDAGRAQDERRASPRRSRVPRAHGRSGLGREHEREMGRRDPPRHYSVPVAHH